VSEDTIRMNGITHNSILRNLVLAYPHFNWDGIRQDIKLLAVE
jgi:hypothetical protein